MNYTYTDIEYGYAKYLLDNPPQKIWWSFLGYYFVYDNFYFHLTCEARQANSQNDHDEAIIGTLTKHADNFVAEDDFKLVCKNEKTDAVFIVRTCLYFTTYQPIPKPQRLVNRIRQKLYTLLTGKKDAIGDILSKSIGVTYSDIVEPQSDKEKAISEGRKTIIDVGLLIEINGKYLGAFVQNNGYGFPVYEYEFFFEKKDYSFMKGEYQLLPV